MCRSRSRSTFAGDTAVRVEAGVAPHDRPAFPVPYQHGVLAIDVSELAHRLWVGVENGVRILGPLRRRVTARCQPFMPNGIAGVTAAAATVFFAYIGFDAVTTTAEEARNPQRDLPIGIMMSLGICTILYVSVAAVLTGLVPYTQIDIHAPVAEALRLVGYKWGAAVVAMGAVAGITSVLVVMMLGQIRVFFAISRDGLLGSWLSVVHPRFGTPHHATILTGIGVAVMAAFVPIGTAADMTNIGTFFAFTLVCIGLIVLRYTRPHLARPFKTPFMPWIPLLGAFSCLGLMWQLPALTWHRFVRWTIAGIIIYGL